MPFPTVPGYPAHPRLLAGQLKVCPIYCLRRIGGVEGVRLQSQYDPEPLGYRLHCSGRHPTPTLGESLPADTVCVVTLNYGAGPNGARETWSVTLACVTLACLFQASYGAIDRYQQQASYYS